MKNVKLKWHKHWQAGPNRT